MAVFPVACNENHSLFIPPNVCVCVCVGVDEVLEQ